MQIFVKTYSRSDEDQKTTILGKILVEEGHQTPSKILAGEDNAPRQDPCRATRQGPQRGRQQGRCQARTSQVSTAVRMQLPAQTSWAGTCVATCSFQANSAGACVAACRSSLRPYHRATSAACLPTWRRTHRWPGRVSKRGGAATNETGLAPVPDKARGHLSYALNVPCPVIRAISS